MNISFTAVLWLGCIHSASSLQSVIGEQRLEQFVYVKFHYVGSGTAFKTIDMVRNESGPLRNLASGPIYVPHTHHGKGLSKPVEDSYRISHSASLPMMSLFVKHGAVPKTTWAVTLMRLPGDQALSQFYERYFHLSNSVYHHPFNNLTKNKVNNLWDTDSVQRAIIGYAYKPETEYTHYLKDARTALVVLSQFKIVGVTHDSDETFYEPLAKLLDVPIEVMRKAKVACTEHVREEHPHMSDFSVEFNLYMEKAMGNDYDIYKVAERLSGTKKSLLRQD